jgi:CBS domain-containing protein
MSSLPIIVNPVHMRVILRDEDPTATRSVFCKRRGQLLPLAECVNCAHIVSMPATLTHAEPVVTCFAPAAVDRERGDIVERAARTSLGELIRRRFACVRANAGWETLESLLLDENIDAVPVIDEQDRPIGIVSKSDLLRRARDGADDLDGSAATDVDEDLHVDLHPHATAAEVMTPVVHTLPEDAPLSFAVALLALEDIDQIPVVSSDGEVVGLLAARDAVRWFAQQMGYVVKAPGA